MTWRRHASRELQAELRALQAAVETRRVLEAAALEERAIADQRDSELVRAAALCPDAIDGWLERAGVGRVHRQRVVDPELIPAALRDYKAELPDALERGGGAIVCGPPGAGKTTAAIELLREVYRSGSATPTQWTCPSGLFVTAARLYRMVFERRPLETLACCGLLVIDDLGVAHESAWPLGALDELIDVRWSEMRPTIITTNLLPAPDPHRRDLDAVSTRYPRIASRLGGVGGPGIVTLARGDLRTGSRS